jgi:hypothetical protein
MPKKIEEKSPLEKRTRCPKGRVRNKKTGVCIAKVVDNVAIKSTTSKKNKTQKMAHMLTKRRECIENWRRKHLRNSSSRSSTKSSSKSSMETTRK